MAGNIAPPVDAMEQCAEFAGNFIRSANEAYLLTRRNTFGKQNIAIFCSVTGHDHGEGFFSPFVKLKAIDVLDFRGGSRGAVLFKEGAISGFNRGVGSVSFNRAHHDGRVRDEGVENEERKYGVKQIWDE